MSTLKFGEPEHLPTLVPAPGKGHPIILHYPEGNVTYLTDQFNIPNVQEYSAFLARILNDASFTPEYVPTPAWIASQVQQGIMELRGKLPDNWHNIYDQLVRAYDIPLRAFLATSEAGRKRGSSRSR